MGLLINGSGVVITKGGIKKLDTRDKFLQGNTWGFPISGSQFIANVAGGNSGGGGNGRVNTTTVYDLGAAPDGHDYVYGTCKFDLDNNAAGLAFDRWHMVMNGSILWVMDGDPADQFTGDNLSVRQYVDYFFRINSGRVEMVRRLFISDSPFDYVVISHTITYKLRTGAWV